MISRDVLWKRTVQSLVGGLVLATLIFLGLSALPENFSRLVWLPIAGLGFAIPYALLVARIACLECKFPLFRSGVFRIKLGSIKYRINYCPHCGAHLDADTGPNQSFKPTPSARLNSRR